MSDPATSYELRLRDVGRRLDAGGHHNVTIIEVEGGLIVRAMEPGKRTPQVIEIVDDPVPTRSEPMRTQANVPHRLFPNGYTRFLAALGARLDRGRATAIVVVEGTDFVTVGGLQPAGDDAGGAAFDALDILLLPDDIAALSEVADLAPVDTPALAGPSSTDLVEKGRGMTDRLGSAFSTLRRKVQTG